MNEERSNLNSESAKSHVLYNFFLVVLVVVGLLVAANVFLKQQDEMLRVEKRASDLAELEKIIEADSNLVQERSGNELSEAEIEKTARDELGMLKPGEIIFKENSDQ